MPVRSLLDLTQMIPTVPVTSGNVLQPGTPFYVQGYAGGGGAVTPSITDGWFDITRPAVAGGESIRTVCAWKKLDDITWGSTSVGYLGIRLKSSMTGPANIPLITMCDTAGPANNTQDMLYRTDLPDGGVAGVEYYFEIGIDNVNKLFYRRINGNIRLADIPFTSTFNQLVGLQRLGIAIGYPPGVGMATTVALSYSFRDMYFVEKTGNTTTDTWLGPRKVVPITVDLVTAPWSASDGTDPKTVFNKPIVTADDLLTPYAITDDDSTEAQIKLNSQGVGNITAIALSFNARKPGGTAVNLRTKITSGGVDSTNVLTPLDTTMGKKAFYMSETTPDGLPWTLARLKAATLKVAPVNA